MDSYKPNDDRRNLAIAFVAFLLLVIVVAGLLTPRAVPPVPPTVAPPTVTSTPLPLVEVPPTETPTPTSSPTLTYDQIDATVLAMNKTRTPEPATPAVNPVTGDARANIGAGIAWIGGIMTAVGMALYYTRVKKL